MPKPIDRLQLRDARRVGYFQVDNEIVDDFGPIIGKDGIAVYAALCRYAGQAQQCEVGLRKLCKQLRTGRTSLLNTLGVLEEQGLIAMERGDRENASAYAILSVPKQDRGGPIQDQGGEPKQDYPRSQVEPPRGSKWDRKKTGGENTKTLRDSSNKDDAGYGLFSGG